LSDILESRFYFFNGFFCWCSFIKRIWRRGCCNNKVDEADEVVNHDTEDFLTYELQKEPLVDFTLSEYTEKGTIQKCISTVLDTRI
jgi:hypothetical protein